MDKEQILLLGYKDEKGTYRNFNNKLKKNFIENVDYKLVKNDILKNAGSGGHNKKIYEITPDTLKTLIMEAKTKNSADIRQYFLKVETLFLSYFDFKCKIKNKSFENKIEDVKKLNHIKEFSKNENIKRLENKIEDENAIGVVYFIREEKTSYYKIGFTSHLKKRLEKLQVGNRKTLSIYKYFYCNSPNVYENLIHKELQEYHIKGEWYKLEKKIIKTIIKKYEN